MAEFSWEARGRTGELRAGTMVADNIESVNTRLRKQNLNPVKVKKKPITINLQLGTGVDVKDLVTFTRLFATMIDAGLPLVQCLDILANQQPKPAFAAVLKDIKNSVEGGSTFSDALRKHPRIFDELFVNLIQAGEAGGILDNILSRLSIYLEKRQKLVRQVKGALSYPTIVFFIAIGVMAVMLTFVIPAFENMFKEFGGGADSLPALTRFMVHVSHGFISFLPLTIALLVGLGSGFSYAIKQPRGKRIFHKTLLSLPIMGNVLKK